LIEMPLHKDLAAHNKGLTSEYILADISLISFNPK